MSPMEHLLALALATSLVLANPFVYPYANAVQAFSETLEPGACVGVFEGAETNFTCPCVSSESFSTFINCAPATPDAVVAFCSAPKASCGTDLCPTGTCPDLELNGTYVPESTCSGSTTLGWKAVVGCGCYSQSDKFTACTPAVNSTGPMMCTSINQVLDGTVSDGVSHLCTPQCSDGTSSCVDTTSPVEETPAVEDDGSSMDDPFTADADVSSGSDVDIAMAMEDIVALTTTRVVATSTVFIPQVATQTTTSIVKLATTGASFKFKFPPECCPTSLVDSLKPIARRHLRHRRRGTSPLTMTTYETVDGTAIDTSAGDDTQTVTVVETQVIAAPTGAVRSMSIAWGCEAPGRNKDQIKWRVARLLATKQEKSGGRVLVDCGSAGLFKYMDFA